MVVNLAIMDTCIMVSCPQHDGCGAGSKVGFRRSSLTWENTPSFHPRRSPLNRAAIRESFQGETDHDKRPEAALSHISAWSCADCLGPGRRVPGRPLFRRIHTDQWCDTVRYLDGRIR